MILPADFARSLHGREVFQARVAVRPAIRIRDKALPAFGRVVLERPQLLSVSRLEVAQCVCRGQLISAVGPDLLPDKFIERLMGPVLRAVVSLPGDARRCRPGGVPPVPAARRILLAELVEPTFDADRSDWQIAKRGGVDPFDTEIPARNMRGRQSLYRFVTRQNTVEVA